MYDKDNYVIPRFTFSSVSLNESIEVSIGGDKELVLDEILRSFRGFLVASGFDYVAYIEAGYHNGDCSTTKEDEDYIAEEELQFNKPNSHSISKSEYEHSVSMSGDAEPF